VAASSYLHIDQLREELVRLEELVAAPDLWSDPDHAREVTTAYNRARADIEEMEGFERRLADAETLLELGADASVVTWPRWSGNSRRTVCPSSALDTLELRSLFSGPHDESDAIGEIHAGAGAPMRRTGPR